MQTFEAGAWHSSKNDTWADQTVFQSERVKDSNIIICTPFDFQDEKERMPNLANEDDDMDLDTNVSISTTEIAAIPDLGDTFTIESGSLQLDSATALGHFAGKGTITAQANGGSGLVKHTSAGHNLKVGDSLVIYNTTSYDGTYEVISVAVDVFFLEQTFVANDASSAVIVVPIFSPNTIAAAFSKGIHPL